MTFTELVSEYGHIGILYMQTNQLGILIEIVINGKRYFVSFGESEELAVHTAYEVLETWV